MKRSLVITENYGGLAPDLKQGPEKSFANAEHIDFRKSPTSITVLPEARKETDDIVVGLITEMIQLPSGKKVAIDNEGWVYTRIQNGTWEKLTTQLPDTAAGMSYNLQHDTIYVSGLTAMHAITHADSRFGGTITVVENAIDALVDQSASDSTNTYTTTGSITETTAHQLTFVPSIEPCYSLKLWVTAKGNTNIVVTLHDAAHNTLGTVTKLAADITNGALNEFVFDLPIRTSVRPNASTYHFHVTHSSGTASTIGCATASELGTARFQTICNRFVEPNNGFHPMTQFLQYILIGNERYLAAWEPISQSDPTALEFNQHKLVFPSGYECTSMASWTEYIAIACEKRSSSATNEFQDGKIFFWDGTSSTYNLIQDVPEGSPYGLFSHKNVLYWWANGGWWAWSGGNPVKIYQMPSTDFEYTDTNTYMVNNPNTMTVRNGILLGAFPSFTNSEVLEHMVYSFGARNKNYPEAFGKSYTISTGNKAGAEIQLGMIKSFGDKLFISWKDGDDYGVDIVDPNSDPFSEAFWESLIIDNGRPDRTKQAAEMMMSFEPLPEGATVTPKYKINRADAWTYGTAAEEGATSLRFNINKRYKEIQLGYDLEQTDTTPEITSVVFVWDTLSTERD